MDYTEAINFLTDAIEYLRGRDGAPPDSEAAMDALIEAQEAIVKVELGL